MRHLGYYVHHHGAGHVTRAAQIAAHLRVPVTGLSSLPAPTGWPGEWIELPRDDTPPTIERADTSGGWVEADAGGALHWAPLEHEGYRERMGMIADWIRRQRPDLLVVDVSVEVTLLARLLGVPVVVAAMRGDRRDPPHRAAYDAARVLLAPWPVAATPRGAGRAGHVSGVGDPWAAKTVHVGGLSRFDGISGFDGISRVDRRAQDHVDGPGPDPVSDPGIERSPARPADALEPGTPSAPLVAVLWGRGGGDWTRAQRRDAQRATPGWRWEFAGEERDVWSCLRDASVVITHAGQNAVAEVAAARRPAIVVALDRPHGEQEATLAAIADADLAQTCVGLPDAALWPELLERARCRDGSAWRAWSDGFGGYRAARAIEAAARGRALAARTAVLTLVHGRHDLLRGLVAGIAAGTHTPERLVVVALGDPDVAAVCRDLGARFDVDIEIVELPLGPDAHLPLARARNVAAARAEALGCRTLVFLDVDCIPSRTLVGTYAESVQDCAAAGTPDRTGPTVFAGSVAYLPPAPTEGYDLEALPELAPPHPARPAPEPGSRLQAEVLRLFWSLSFALSTADFAATGGFDESYVGYGGEDTDFAMRLGAAGGSLWWLGGAAAFHQHHPTQNPRVQHVHDIVRNANLFARRWGWHPMEGWLAGFAEAGLASLDPSSGEWRVT